MSNILITGANGQLGTSLRKISGSIDDFEFIFTDVDTLDICNKAQVEAFVRSRSIQTIINCAAYTAVDSAEDNTELCYSINRDAVRNLGEAAADAKARVIHVSTDYVFDGQSSRPYRESDATNPQSVYGASKLAGEQALTAVCGDSVIVRTAWLYSATGTNFVRTMLRLGAERDEIGVVADQRGTPTCADDLAAAIIKILTAKRFVPGVYHYTNAGECTWFDFAVKIMEIAGLKCKVRPLTTAEYPTRAHRPAYSVLDKTKIIETYHPAVPQWEEHVGAGLAQLIIDN
ncbi:MAG: dTDP-4-dehydrorhamnose reductase [Tannerella sp.]|jgi:dTDP-4-dehydrorhamnose reductase|nr:dTDP-4-dehydrorhamnose reductase [Tannerella sp.]